MQAALWAERHGRRVQGIVRVELVGLEPTTSWVRYGNAVARGSDTASPILHHL